MKISLTFDEVKAGQRDKRLSPKALGKIIDAKATCPLFLLSDSMDFEGTKVNAALVTEIIGLAGGDTRVSFERVSARVFTVYDAKTKDLRSATLLMPHGQFTFTQDGKCERSAFSLSGPGVDPETVQKSWTALSSIFSETGNATICSRIVEHLRESLIKVEKKAA